MEDCIQLSLFGKMFPERSQATKVKISEPFWKNLPGSQKQTLAFLDLRKESGPRQDVLPEITTALHGGPLMLNIGECPRDAVESRLSWILEDNVPERYYLSAQACQGILNRASRRGKALPEILHMALLDMIEWWKEQEPTTRKIRSGCEGGGKGPLVQTEKSATLSTLQDQTLFVLHGNMIDRNVKQNGSGVSEGETMYSLTSTDRHGVAIPINTQIATRHISLGERTGMGLGEDGDPAYTLQAGHEHAVCCLLNDQGGQHIQVEDGRVSPTLRDESHAHEPVICAAFTAGQGAKANGIGWAKETAPTLRTDGGLSAMPTVLCRAHGQANAETLEDCAPTLNCSHEQPIVFESHSQDARYTQQGDTSPACTAQLGTGGNNMPLVAFSKETYNTGKNASCSLGIESGDIAPTMRADTHPSGVAYKRLRWIVRRLTPTECERLQGFPDGWTDIGEWYDSATGQGYWMDTKGKRHKTADSPRYKALGNSIALPQWWWITCKMAAYLPEHATLGSLFDGIGGFPLVWETRHGKGTAVWASEIEEFPIAVTKKHFGDGKYD